MYLLVGNWCPGPGEKGFSVYEYNSCGGSLTFLNHSNGDIAASFLTKGVRDDLVYATNETDALMDGIPANQIITLDVSHPSEGIRIIARKASFGPNPTWICSAYNQEHLLVTHHGGFCNTSTIDKDNVGNIVEKIVYDESHVILYELDKHGIPDRPADAFLPTKVDYYPGQMSRSHSVIKAPGKNLYMICDKGLDLVLSVMIDFSTNKIIPLDSVSVPRHFAPRYGVFHKNLPIFYADMEGSATIYAFSYDELGNIQILQTLDLTKESKTGAIKWNGTMPSDIILNSAGNRLYVGLRGINWIAVIDLDENGTMSVRQFCENRDGAPNALRLSPDGNYLFVTNVFEKVITRFAVAEDGSLAYQGIAAESFCPASMLFLP